jgi:hypothetical protein
VGTNKNKTVRTNSNRKIVGAIKEHLTEPVTLLGVKYTPAKLAKVFQEGIEVADATDRATKAWHAAVATEKKSTEDISNVQLLLRNHVTALFGEASTEFADFGFAPKKVTEADAQTKAVAVVKRAATRVARHTMGKREKKKVTGENTPVAADPTAVATPVATPVAPAGAVAPSPPSVATGLGSSATSQMNGAAAPAKAIASA